MRKPIKKIVAGVLLAALLVPSAAMANPFLGGQSGTHQSNSGYKASYHQSYISGFPDGTMRPDQKITKAEFAAMLHRLSTESGPQTQGIPLNDISGHWAYNDIVWAYENGYIGGDKNRYFGPNMGITRAQVAYAVVMQKKPAENINARFFDTNNHWAEKQINIARTQGWVSGYTDGSFRPNEVISRAEAVMILNRAFNRVPDYAAINRSAQYKNGFSDMSNKHWAYYDMVEAIHQHYFFKQDGHNETWKL